MLSDAVHIYSQLFEQGEVHSTRVDQAIGKSSFYKSASGRTSDRDQVRFSIELIADIKVGRKMPSISKVCEGLGTICTGAKIAVGIPGGQTDLDSQRKPTMIFLRSTELPSIHLCGKNDVADARRFTSASAAHGSRPRKTR